jgi:hypothetical protein
MAKAQPGNRVVLQLDPRVALEAIILNRLGQVPANRRQEWLRGLLVQGFRTECQVLRGLSSDGASRPVRAFATRPAQTAKTTDSDPKRPTPMQTTDVSDTEKPFAALRKVIG